MKPVRLYLWSVALSISATAFTSSAAAPANYYKSCEGKTGRALLEQLETVVGPHTTVGYKSLYTVYATSDVHPDGTIWDMYSTKNWGKSFDAVKCGNYSVVGDCINKEHSFPKSWFDDASPMYSDAFHIYPTDGKVNGQRSNYPYGECANGSTLASNGNVKPLGKLGNSTFPGYSGRVFEPADEYKGDFARSYFYMAAAYNERIDDWNSPMLAGNTYPAFSSWAINLLLKWHRQDPVSEKETVRNDAVYKHQRNRNPFIDYPDLAEHIWGNKVGQPWSSTADDTPAIISPVNDSSISLPTALVGTTTSANVTVKGANLPGDVTVSVSGTGFTVSQTTVSKADALAGKSITVSFSSAVAGTFKGALTVKSGNLTSIADLSATIVTELPPAPPVPSVTFLFDGELAFYTTPGIPSDPAELLIEVEDIDGPVTLAVKSPFELSLNKQQWGSSVVIEPGADRFYMRLNSPAPGEFSTSIVATAANGFYYDDVEVEGVVTADSGAFHEDFEVQAESSGNYNDKTYVGTACEWQTNALFEYNGSNSYPHDGSQAARFGKSGNRYLTMLRDKPKGMGTVSFWARPWRAESNDCVYAISVSSDHGTSWEKIGDVTAKANNGSDNTYQQLSLPINRTGSLRLKVEQTSGGRSMFDDLVITDHENSALLTPEGHDYHSWDAYCVNGELVLETADPANAFHVYSIDGMELFSGNVDSTTLSLPMPAGIYVVNVADFSRRVLVK